MNYSRPARLAVPLCLPVAALALAAWQQPAPPATGLDAERLERALETVSAQEIASDLYFLASDEMAGRDSPSEEQRLAARFIRARLQRLGLEPGAPEGFLYDYTLPRTALDPERCGAMLARESGATTPLGYATDYWIGSRWGASPHEITGEIVYGGRGTRDELEGLDLEGKWVVGLDDGGNSRNRANTARAAGAVGLLLIQSPEYDDAPYAERHAGTADSLAQGRLGSSRASSGQPFASLYVAPSVAADLLAGAPDRPADAGADWLPAVGAALGATFTETRAVLEGDDAEAHLENVCGFWRGSDPELWRETILISAHYDHVGTRGGEVYNGADDNGSGTVGLMAVAEALTELGPLRRSVLLIWVSAEEKGLLGSEAWVANPWLPDGAVPVANINIDMIGRNAPDQLLYTPTPELTDFYNGLAQVVERLAPGEGFTDLGSADAYYHRSDQANFEQLGIPVMFLFTDVHEDYHQPGDTPDKIDYDKIRRVVRVVVRMLTELQTDTLDLAVEAPAPAEEPAEEPAPSGAGSR